jgi:hypothetical protein
MCILPFFYKANKQKSVASTMMAATLDQYKIEELETSLLIQKDENDAIKAALRVTLIKSM